MGNALLINVYFKMFSCYHGAGYIRTLEHEAVQSEYFIPPTHETESRARITEGHALFSEVLSGKGHRDEPNVVYIPQSDKKTAHSVG